MESKNNSYLAIAKNEYQYIINNTQQGFNNIKVTLCQQVCEKLLKHVITKVCPGVDVPRTHNLKRLYDNISEEIQISRISECYLGTLSDFYFDARYPGDDYVDVSDEDLDMTMNVTKEIYEKVLEWECKRTPKKDTSQLLAAARKGIVK